MVARGALVGLFLRITEHETLFSETTGDYKRARSQELLFGQLIRHVSWTRGAKGTILHAHKGGKGVLNDWGSYRASGDKVQLLFTSGYIEVSIHGSRKVEGMLFVGLLGTPNGDHTDEWITT